MKDELSRTVTVATSSAKNPTTFHTKICVNYPWLGRTIPLENARRRDLPHCKHCSGDVEKSGGSGPELAAKLRHIGKQRADD